MSNERIENHQEKKYEKKNIRYISRRLKRGFRNYRKHSSFFNFRIPYRSRVKYKKTLFKHSSPIFLITLFIICIVVIMLDIMNYNIDYNPYLIISIILFLIFTFLYELWIMGITESESEELIEKRKQRKIIRDYKRKIKDEAREKEKKSEEKSSRKTRGKRR